MVRRIHRIVLLFVLLIGGAGMNYVQAATHSGNCGANGNNVIWSLNTSTGVLTISGSGAMKDFVSSSGAPWYLDRMSITSVTIANGVTTIGNYAFYACVKLSSVAIPSSVTSIGNSGFTNCTKLTSVNIPNSVTNIGIYAFNHCSSLISVNIPNGVTSIGEFTFNGCSSLTSMTIPNSVASIGVSAFRDCSALTDVYASWTGDAVPDMPADIHPHDASQKRLHIPCGQAGAYFAKGWNTKFTLPDVVSGTCGDNVQWTFESCNGTLSIFGTGEMMNYYFGSLDKVPWYSYREAVKSVIVTSGVTNIGDYAFYRCSSLTSVTLPTGLVTIGNDAFHYCSELSSIIIPDNVTSIGDYAFSVCSSLTSVTLPSGLVTIGNGAFSYCSELSSIIIPDNVTSIGNYAFYRCSKISSVTFPNGLISIGQFAFGENESLSSITIPRSVTDVGWRAFGYLDNEYHPNDITVEWTENIPFIIEVTNSSPQSDITLHVPCGTEELYKAADGWKDYTIEGEGGPYTVTVQAEDPTMGDVSITVNP